MILLTGGARSGKSRGAVSVVGQDDDVVYLATGVETDEEMADRIERHRLDRPASWEVVEEPVALEAAIRSIAIDRPLIVDCLTLWVANLLVDRSDDSIEQESLRASQLASNRAGATVVVTNEVGSGIVPMDPVGRRYRDLVGRVNQMWAEQADQSFLVVAGGLIELASLDSLDA